MFLKGGVFQSYPERINFLRSRLDGLTPNDTERHQPQFDHHPVIDSLCAELEACAISGRLWVALSGGRDSVVLATAVHALATKLSLQIGVIHVHHGLQASADTFRAFCREWCLAHGVELLEHSVELDGARGNIEARAREARYRLFARVLGRQDVIATAHHLGDQAETLILHLLRGSGARGLAAMARERVLGEGRLLRPMLGVHPDAIADFARRVKLTWVEDPMNDDRRFARVKVRQERRAHARGG
jgi:tRNA(Ile)-lysidine synthase